MDTLLDSISVILPVYLGEYEGCAKNRPKKFRRAVQSFIEQKGDFKAELIIVSDGCEQSIEIYNENKAEWTENESRSVKLIPMGKQSLFSGSVRQQGVLAAKGSIVCYLDSDDFFGKTHLNTILQAFRDKPKLDWVYYNDLIRIRKNNHFPKEVALEHGSIGTSSIAHRNYPSISWNGCDGYGHDWTFIERLIKTYPNNEKIFGCVYYICHIPNQIDS